MSQEALEAMPFPFAICICDGIYVGANVRMEQLFQAPSAARIGVFNLLNDPLMQDNDSHAIFQAAVAGQHGQAPLLYYAVPFPATRNPDRVGCWAVGAPLLQFFAEHERIPHLVQLVLTQGGWQGTMGYRRTDGSLLDAHLTAFVVRDESGAPIALSGIARDITEQQRAEEERAVLREQVIAAQQATLRELSTPLIPIAEGVVAMPLIGSIDSSRA